MKATNAEEHVNYGDRFIYHYTSATALENIVRSRSLYLSDVSAMNDTAEVSLAFDMVEGMLTSHGGKYDLNYLGAVRSVVDLARTATLFPLFVASFCEDGDLLSQWRAYGPQQGFALGFDRVALAQAWSSGNDGESDLNQVLYSHTPQANEFLETRLVEIFEAAPVSPQQHVNLARGLRQYVPLIKHEAFKEEREWRVIYMPSQPGEGKARAVPGRGLLHFVGRAFPVSALYEVVVGPGPMQEAQLSAVRALLGPGAALGDHHVVVTKSRIPYRS